MKVGQLGVGGVGTLHITRHITRHSSPALNASISPPNPTSPRLISPLSATGPEFGQPKSLDGPKAMDSPSVSIWEEEEKGTIVFATLTKEVPPSAMQVTDQAETHVNGNGGGLRGANAGAVESGEVGERGKDEADSEAEGEAGGQVSTGWEPQWTQRGWTTEAPAGA